MLGREQVSLAATTSVSNGSSLFGLSGFMNRDDISFDLPYRPFSQLNFEFLKSPPTCRWALPAVSAYLNQRYKGKEVIPGVPLES